MVSPEGRSLFPEGLKPDLPVEMSMADKRQIFQLSGERGMSPFVYEGGRPHIRRVLYMATLTAIKHNPAIRAFHRRLVTAGRPGKVALTAAMRKLLTILNAMLRDRRPWHSA